VLIDWCSDGWLDKTNHAHYFIFLSNCFLRTNVLCLLFSFVLGKPNVCHRKPQPANSW
jgi:hypothetical protein